MADRRTIKSEWVTSLLGYRWRTPKFDADGQPLVDGDGPALESATTRDIITAVVLGIPASIQRRLDSIRVAACINQMEKDGSDKRDDEGKKTPGPDIELKPKVYEWLHALLDRKLPLTKEAKESNIKPRTYGMSLFDMHEAFIVNQIKDVDERKTVLDDDEDE